jgi:hypothetical protein
LLISGIRALSAHLLNPPQSVNKFLHQPEVRAQPPEQKDQQQGYQGDNYQVFQIAFSAGLGRLMVSDVR